ncbi:MAG TPA: cation diffusion facilitator family transporter [Gemmatimonadales bacterium]|nr:cation diffusion facilitator family transporter [Gemmatimonadales bacterium]
MPNRLLIVLVITAVFMVVEAAAGWVSGALALVADAGHMLTDVGALGLSLFTATLARRPADPRRTYGYLRWEILAALINGAVLFGLAAWVVVEAVGRIGQPHPIQTGLFMVVAAVGLVVNLVSLWVLHGSHHGNLNARGAYLHVLGDALGSVAALGAAVLIRFTGWTVADPIVSIALSLLILVGAWRLLRESTDILLEGVPAHISLPDVRARMLEVPGTSAVHDLHVWTVTSGVVALSGHVVVPDLAAHPAALAGLKEAVAGLGIGHATIQLEVEDECRGVDCLEPLVASDVGGHIHGPGEQHDHRH